jgi:hypothetical protein
MRPSWNCVACGQPWPCAVRRGELSRDDSDERVQPAVLLVASMVECARDLLDLDAMVLWRRFHGWRRPTTVTYHP